MTFSAKDMIRQRKSVRTFDGRSLSDADRKQLEDYINTLTNPFDVPVEFSLLDAKEHNLSSPVIVGTDTYIAGKMERAEHAEEAFGYFFEELVLYIQSLGLGTTWIGGTMDRKAFEDAMELNSNEVMPCVSPIGKPADKRSIRETMMRKGLRADSRKKFEELFFDGSIDVPLSEARYPELSEILEAVRLAPSAVNKQPWRVIVTPTGAHFYIKHDMGYIDSTGWDMQKIDMGIALCHFMSGTNGALELQNPGITTEAGTEYIASVVI